MGMGFASSTTLTTGRQKADERHGNPPQGNQGPLLSKDTVGRPQVILG